MSGQRCPHGFFFAFGCVDCEQAYEAREAEARQRTLTDNHLAKLRHVVAASRPGEGVRDLTVSELIDEVCALAWKWVGQ